MKITILALLLPLVCGAQDIVTSTLLWRSHEATDLRNNVDFPLESVFKTYGTDSVVWTQTSAEDTVVHIFKVTGYDGEWQNVQSLGEIIYAVEWDGVTGTIQFSRKRSNLSITVDLTASNPYAIKNRFKIQNIVQP